ncbi:hypothetical protein OG890_21000 [Streptomyces anulatus]|uniref:hypothetical protein n=1 Tax=Streptomyces anulatus TaxID=1892 RepID=UPI00224DB11F|nr:hypothetical protein [Streptomyces anulatus]MCX4486396.1 hypothetical protein [Streptomyces anulatus]MCX4523376.1 hypothetical protein [Streptomyces anulatus]MCX4606386.1 hypothetical protein [Streptomyces anulatus]WTD23168.1 hypothetical protein OH737_00865 [Streptomyces anulatus]
MAGFLITDEHLGDLMNGQDTPGSAKGFSVFAVDANWPESRQVMGHGHSRVTGDVHVYLWFGSPHFDAEAEHVTVLSASSGNAESTEALERDFELYVHPGEEPPASLPASVPVTISADGKPLTFECWRNSSNPSWVARGRIGSTEVVLSGSIEPSMLSLVRVSDLTSFSNPFAPLMKDFPLFGN